MDVLLDYILTAQTFILVFVVVLLKNSIKFVPQNRAYVIERFGKFQSSREAGLNFILPFIDRVSADRSLKEQAVDVPEQSAITKDNISLSVDGVLYFRVLDAYKATYGVDDYVFAVTQLAQTTMRSELGKMELDKTFEERDVLNTNIVMAINDAAGPWGIQVLRYEITYPSLDVQLHPIKSVFSLKIKQNDFFVDFLFYILTLTTYNLNKLRWHDQHRSEI